MTTKLRELVETASLSMDEIAGRTAQIGDTLLRGSQWLDGGNFRCINPDDLRMLFEEYDRLFFDGGCRRALGEMRLEFRLSQRMTRAAGKTVRHTPRNRAQPPWYEIAIAVSLLYQAFQEGDRPVTVSGVRCASRLDALQRVLEHEMLHLVESLVWGESNCAGRRFQSIALRLFGHTAHTHSLITPRERAFTARGIAPGSRVRFQFEGAEYAGIVNRVTKRATVLVEDPRGEPYSDGKRYRKFYVPVAMLELEQTPPRIGERLTA